MFRRVIFHLASATIPSAAYAAIIIAIVTFGQNIGMTLGPLVVGYIVDAAGAFEACAVPLGILAVIGGIIMLFVKVKPASDAGKQGSSAELPAESVE